MAGDSYILLFDSLAFDETVKPALQARPRKIESVN
jgi:hypothetical protein